MSILNFLKLPKEEGFDQVAGAFDMIAKVEAVHGRSFCCCLQNCLEKISILKIQMEENGCV